MEWRKGHGLPAKMLEVGLWLVASVCVGVIGVWKVEARRTDLASNSLLPMNEENAGSGSVVAGDVIARLMIPQLRLSVPVLESYKASSLNRGVGHVPGTAFPGGLGNMVLAGHRDTYFRPLRNVQTGMNVQIINTAGRWNYVIDGTEIVSPERVDVLDIGDQPGMTLITCYPFNYVGAAPKRFIVHAHLLSADPS